jgi:hypothetical protein
MEIHLDEGVASRYPSGPEAIRLDIQNVINKVHEIKRFCRIQIIFFE